MNKQETWDRIEIYDEVLGHLQLVYDGLTEGEKKQADMLSANWRRAQKRLCEKAPR
jgi:hypothetical protein